MSEIVQRSPYTTTVSYKLRKGTRRVLTGLIIMCGFVFSAELWAFNVFNQTGQDIFARIQIKGDPGNLELITIGPYSVETIRPGGIRCGWTEDCSTKQFTVQFWRDRADFEEAYWSLAAINTAISAAAATTTGGEIISNLYQALDGESYISQFFDEHMYGAATNIPYDGGIVVYWGRYHIVDVGAQPTGLSPPPRDYFLFVDADGFQHEHYYGSAASSGAPPQLPNWHYLMF